MKSIFEGLEWLSAGEAMQYLQLHLPPIQMTEQLFLKQCEARDCPVYVEVDGVSGWDERRGKPATAQGCHKVQFTDALGMDRLPHQLHTTGATRWGEGTTRWKIDLRTQGREFPWIFKPADIKALATKINGAPVPAEKSLHTDEQKGGTESQQRPLTKLEQQDAGLLRELRQMGYDPAGLPPYTPAGGAKAEVKRRLLANHKGLFTESSFKKAWERLSGCGTVAYEKKQLSSPQKGDRGIVAGEDT